MATTSNPTSPRRRWLKRLFWAGVTLSLVLVGLYFFVRSPVFIRSFLLPRVAKALDSEVTIKQADFRPFSSLTLRGLQITPHGNQEAPLLSAEEIRVRYQFASLLGGRLVFDEVALLQPTVRIFERENGESNLDPILRASSKGQRDSAKSPALEIHSATVNRASLVLWRMRKDGKTVLEWSEINAQLTNLQPNGQARAAFDAMFRFIEETNAVASSQLLALAKGEFQIGFNSELAPSTVLGGGTFVTTAGTGSFREFAGLSGIIDGNVSPTEVKQIEVRFKKGELALGTVRAAGPFNAAKVEGELGVQLIGIDHQVLDLLGAPSGLTFGTTAISSSNSVTISESGQRFAVAGSLDIARGQVIRSGTTSPTVEVNAAYDAEISGSLVRLKAIHLEARQGSRPLAQASLNRPMTIGWGASRDESSDASLRINLTDLDLADVRLLLPTLPVTGRANLDLNLQSKQGSPTLAFDANGRLGGITVKSGTDSVGPVEVQLQLTGTTDLRQTELTDYRFAVTQTNQPVATLSGSGRFSSTNESLQTDIALRGSLRPLLALFPQREAEASSGEVEAKARLAVSAAGFSASGRLDWTGLTGRASDFRFNNYEGSLDFDFSKRGDELAIAKALGRLKSGSREAGQIELTGNYNNSTRATTLEAKLTQVNELGLGPFLQPLLGAKQLISVELKAGLAVRSTPNRPARWTAELEWTNLVVKESPTAPPSKPLDAHFRFETTVQNKIAEVTRGEIFLTPTERASNQLKLAGTLDFSKTNALTGRLRASSDALDITRYYDLYAAQSDDDPASPIRLPIENLSLELDLGHLYLRELDVAKLQAASTIRASLIELNPLRFELNGGPVVGDGFIDLAMADRKYRLALDAQRVPLGPLFRSFDSDRKVEMEGALNAQLRIEGAGFNGPVLQRSLSGQFAVASTNLNLSLSKVRSPVLNTIVSVVVVIPELTRNPATALGNLVGNLAGLGNSQPGWTDQLIAHPLDAITAQGSIGAGTVEMSRLEARSSMFHIASRGTIRLAPALSNSVLNLPVTISLNEAIAAKVPGLAGTKAEAGYVHVPDFLTLKGTLSKPEASKDTVALIGLAARTGAGVVGQVGGNGAEAVGQVLGAVGNILGGVLPSNASSTNATATSATNRPASPLGGFLDLLRPRQ